MESKDLSFVQVQYTQFYPPIANVASGHTRRSDQYTVGRLWEPLIELPTRPWQWLSASITPPTYTQRHNVVSETIYHNGLWIGPQLCHRWPVKDLDVVCKRLTGFLKELSPLISCGIWFARLNGHLYLFMGLCVCVCVCGVGGCRAECVKQSVGIMMSFEANKLPILQNHTRCDKTQSTKYKFSPGYFHKCVLAWKTAEEGSAHRDNYVGRPPFNTTIYRHKYFLQSSSHIHLDRGLPCGRLQTAPPLFCSQGAPPSGGWACPGGMR